MLESDRFYIELPWMSEISEDCLELAENDGGFIEFLNFKCKMMDHQKAIKDPFIEYLAKNIPIVVGVMRMEPNTIYNWHKDGNRKCAINMLVNDAPSKCVFNVSTDGYMTKYAELKYKEETYYLFNTEEPHMIVNGDKPRYLMSINFGSELTYHQLIELVKGYK